MTNLSILQKFSSYVELIEAIDKQQNQANCKRSVIRSQTITTSSNNLTGTEQYKVVLEKKLKYETNTFACEKGSKRKSKAKMKEATTKKMDCTTGFKDKLKSNKLVITECSLEHHELCNG